MSVSVVVRCASREKLFHGVLNRLLHQTTTPSEILIIMDSWNPAEVRYVKRHLEDYPACKLVTFKHKEFSHPYSTNLGIASSKEDLVCIINGHAFPISLRWLEAGLKHFEDEKVAGVGGFFYPSKKGFANRIYNLVELQMKRISSIATINCIIRKSRWEDYPFDENLLEIIPESRKFGGEDYDWTLEMLSRGYRIVLDPDFSVIHIHKEDIILETLRNLRSYFIYKKLHGKIKRLERPREPSLQQHQVTL